MKNENYVIDCNIVLRQQLMKCHINNQPVSALGIESVLNDIRRLRIGELDKKALLNHNLLSITAIAHRIKEVK